VTARVGWGRARLRSLGDGVVVLDAVR